MREYIQSFCKEFQYPAEAQESLLGAYDKLTKNKNASEIFQEQLDIYNRDELKDYDAALERMKQASELSGAHPYSVDLLFYICLSKHMRERYEQQNITYRIFYDSMLDLKYKLYECHKLYNVWGTFVASWFPRFFCLTRFALGRLQFETVTFDRTYSKNGNRLNPGDLVLNMHIPSSGPLRHEDCLDSYRRASVFYKEYFAQRPTAFVCQSWLLFPSHREILPKTSNIFAFMNDFEILSSGFHENYDDLWRIFYKQYTGNIDELPQDTSLQRAYVDWIRKGNRPGYGYGVFLFDGSQIL